jgi:D-alanyl-D-alanine-carboxypeptidase/D-alanyl-D-alanine-endopeptidase
MLEEMVRDGRTVGIVVGLLDSDGSRRVFAHGSSGSGAPLDGESVFEIGSITKVFTGILLADMGRRGEVELTAPVARQLPPQVRVPSRNGKEITLLDLATHRSGLPMLPDNFPESDPNPFADYTVESMYEFLSRYELPRDPGESFEYSNLGMGLLGHALALRAGTTFEALLKERVLTPFGMIHTAITPTPEMERRQARGHDRAGYPWPNWDWLTLHGAGALRSTVNDMLKFAAANLSGDTMAVHAALRDALQMHRKSTEGDHGSGLGWGIGREGGRVFAAHDGRTYGYSSQLALALTDRRAVVVLTNSYSNGVDGLAAHLLDPTAPLPKASVGLAVATAYRTGGLDAAIQRYRTLHETAPDRWIFDESALNTVGKWLLERGASEDAIAIFRLNAEVYPGSPGPHQTLGSAYSEAGRLKEALESYRRAFAVAEAVDHPDLSRYRADLERLTQQLVKPK